MIRNIYLEPQWKLHSLYKELIDFPPAGITFTVPNSGIDRLVSSAAKKRISYRIQHDIMNPVLPTSLIKSYLDLLARRKPEDTDLTYACEHVVLRAEPWIVDVGSVTNLVGGRAEFFAIFKRKVESALNGDSCRGIICWSELAHKLVIDKLTAPTIREKSVVIPLAVRPRMTRRNRINANVRLLFVNSANIPGQFEIKGGLVALRVFLALKKKYPNLELIIRSDIPDPVRYQLRGHMRGIRLIDHTIEWEELERLFLTSDIFLLPSHFTPGMAILDAMSYGLPVVTIDVYANSELVEHGRWGFVAPSSDYVPYYDRNGLPNMVLTPGFKKAASRIDANMIRSLVDHVSLLIEDESLRHRMGMRGYEEVRSGRFSIEHRNRLLGEFLRKIG